MVLVALSILGIMAGCRGGGTTILCDAGAIRMGADVPRLEVSDEGACCSRCLDVTGECVDCKEEDAGAGVGASTDAGEDAGSAADAGEDAGDEEDAGSGFATCGDPDPCNPTRCRVVGEPACDAGP